MILVEEEDPNLSVEGGGRPDNLGPNPKIRNMSRAYREAKSDLLWIVDCNVWVGTQVAGQMVDLLCGFKLHRGKKYKFVHQLPLSVDLSQADGQASLKERIMASGGVLEETFLSTSHAKFYTAINAVAVAPCIVGKSNMFRRSHLNSLTSSPTSTNPESNSLRGIDYFSHNICEDHLIGDLLWKSQVPTTVQETSMLEGRNPGSSVRTDSYKWGNHAMLPAVSPGNLAIQPMVQYPLQTYIDRRVRWLRVRKFTVLIATLIEPGTESFLCSAYGAFGLTSLTWLQQNLHIPQTWTAFTLIWVTSVICWSFVDRWVWRMLHQRSTGDRPSFMDIPDRRRFWSMWIWAWVGREMLALPIWMCAFYFGGTVIWRGAKLSVGANQRVRMVEEVEAHRRHHTRPVSLSSSSASDTGSGGENGCKRRQN